MVSLSKCIRSYQDCSMQKEQVQNPKCQRQKDMSEKIQRDHYGGL